MTDYVNRFRTAMERRRRYNATIRAIRAMPLDTALDLDIYRGDARRIARRAIYGL